MRRNILNTKRLFGLTVAMVCLLLFMPGNAFTQTAETLRGAHLELTFPPEWTVKRFQIRTAGAPDDQVSVREAFGGAMRAHCQSQTVKRAIIASPKKNPEISIVVFDLKARNPSELFVKGCVLAATDRRVRNVQWANVEPYRAICAALPDSSRTCNELPDGRHRVQAITEGFDDNAWSPLFVAGVLDNGPSGAAARQRTGASLFAVVAPKSEKRKAQRLLKQIYSTRRYLPFDCSSLSWDEAQGLACKTGTKPERPGRKLE